MAAELFIYDEIGPSEWGLIDDKWVINELSKVADDDPITVRINSPGGDAFAGISIYNALNRRTGDVTVEIDALAASAASIIAMSGDEINIAENAMIMIHNAWNHSAGDKHDRLKEHHLLASLDSQLVKTYSRRTGLGEDRLGSLMDETTWFSAEQAVEFGFATGISDPLEIAVSWDGDICSKNAPAEMIARARVLKPNPYAKEADKKARAEYVNRLIAELKIARQRVCG